MDYWLLIPAVVAGYLLGSIPTSVLLARLFGWPDPRQHGSGHTGALNTSRGAGWGGAAAVLLLDVLKGAAAVWAAGRITSVPWAVPLAGAAVVIGHSWPVWLGFRGGMGLSVGVGAVLVRYPLGVLAAGVLLLIARLIIRHPPRATVVAAACVPIALLLLPAGEIVFWLGLGVSLVIVLRHLSDWNRVYEKPPEP